MTTPQLFHTITYRDAQAGQHFLESLGFTRVLVVADENDPSFVQHAEYHWRDTGGVMLGSWRGDGVGCGDPGQAGCYLVVDRDAEVDEIHTRALAHGARSITEPTDEPYGGRGCTVADHEGNQWSFGSYPGARSPRQD